VSAGGLAADAAPLAAVPIDWRSTAATGYSPGSRWWLVAAVTGRSSWGRSRWGSSSHYHWRGSLQYKNGHPHVTGRIADASTSENGEYQGV
jgi:hypothetical protein